MRQRIALVHDNLLEFGGSERILAELLRLYPYADCYTFFFNVHNAEVNALFGQKKWHTSWVQHLPRVEQLAQFFAVLKPFAWWYFSRLDLSHYDVVISTSHSYNSKCVRVQKPAVHISYMQTPPRFLYGLKHEMERYTNFLLLSPLWNLMRKIDWNAAQRPDLLLVNSQVVQRRVKHLYGRDSVVLHPPVRKVPVRGKRSASYYVAHSRLVRQKHIELIVKTCSRAHLPLKVIGDGYMREELEKNAGESVEFLGFIPDTKVAEVYRHAKALLYASEDEDFGIVPVEAQSAGVPVLAFRSGGVLETVRDGITGYFYSRLTERSLMKAISLLEQHPLSARACQMNAERFLQKEFARQLKAHVLRIQKSQ